VHIVSYQLKKVQLSCTHEQVGHMVYSQRQMSIFLRSVIWSRNKYGSWDFSSATFCSDGE